MADTNINCGPIDILTSIRHLATYSPALARDPTKDYTYRADPIEITFSMLGSVYNVSITNTPVELAVSIHGDIHIGTAIHTDPIPIIISLVAQGYTISSKKSNWVKWSKIGRLDFTIDESNVAGERPLDWSGYISEILKLGEKIVVYGDNGVTLLNASGVSYGMHTIHRIGVVCKAVGTDFEHYFIDKKSMLYKLSPDGLQLLDYSEFLSLLTDPKMALDIETGIIYICDGVYGYVYSTRTGSFGSGPINVTGIGTKSGTLYVVAPEEIEVPKLHVATDIYDLGTRKPKTIQWIEVGTDLTVALQAMIETRISNKNRFLASKWLLVNPSGIAYIPCYGVEFKFHLRSYIYEYIELDYIKVVGTVHGANYLDQAG